MARYAEPLECEPESHDPERLKTLEFHIKSGDYFPLLATIMGFLEESVRECENGFLRIAPIESDVVRQMRQDLIHLYKHYQITPKD